MRLAVKITLSLLLLFGVMYMFVFPAHTYLVQKSDIAVQERVVGILTRENATLAARRSALQTRSAIEQIAREEYGLVMPGQQAFMVLPSPSAPARQAPARPRHSAWYSGLEFWHSL
jgi:cell division protein FtsB